jgi:hypothetical protein
VTVTADEKGNWTANLTTGLTAGNIYAWSALNGQNWMQSDNITVAAIPRPVLLHKPYVTRGYANDSLIEGTAAPGALVQIWQDTCGSYLQGKIGRFLLTTTTADANGNWKTTGDDNLPVRFGSKYAVITTINGITFATPFVDPMSRPTTPKPSNSGPSFSFSLAGNGFDGKGGWPTLFQ